MTYGQKSTYSHNLNYASNSNYYYTNTCNRGISIENNSPNGYSPGYSSYSSSTTRYTWGNANNYSRGSSGGFVSGMVSQRGTQQF